MMGSMIYLGMGRFSFCFIVGPVRKRLGPWGVTFGIFGAWILGLCYFARSVKTKNEKVKVCEMMDRNTHKSKVNNHCLTIYCAINWRRKK